MQGPIRYRESKNIGPVIGRRNRYDRHGRYTRSADYLGSHRSLFPRQLFLSDIRSNEQQLQGEIVRKVTKIQPFVRVFGVAAAVMTAGIIGIFTYDAWQHLTR
jgi:hypothetical protein